MDEFFQKMAAIVTEPEVSIPFWGAVGGLVRAIFRKVKNWFGAIFSIALAALFAHLFTLPIVQFFELPPSAMGGVGAVLGITSYEIARMLATGDVAELIKYILNWRK